ncbi:MAG: proprotein convertase P-domain-containing protein [Bacteroidetes bacterium]|nr:proprotein convertase P-domain-containing protein [Bacteroidota bacterium]
MKRIHFPIFKSLIMLPVLVYSAKAMAQNGWNTAAVFNGTNTYYASWESTLNSTSGELTVEFWTKLYENKSNITFLGKNQFRIMTDNGKVRVQTSNSTQMYSTSEIDSGKWTHVAVSISNAANTIKVYLNGSLDNSYTSYSGTLTGTADSLFVGKSPYASMLNGELDELRIWNTIRTASEIQNNMKLHLSWYYSGSYDPSLIFCQTYDFDVYSPGTYFPYGGNHGSFGSSYLGLKPSQTVMHNHCMRFSGSSYLETTSSNDANISLTGPMTIETWIYPTAIGTTQNLIDLSNGSGGYLLQLTSAGKISWTMNQYGTSSTVLTANKWYHIAVVCSTPGSGSQVANIYINGEQDAGYNFSELQANTGKLRIGASHSGTNFFSGYMDEVRISNYAKTPAEIQRYMHSPVCYQNRPSAPKTTVAYNLDGNLYSGTRTGSALKSTGCRFGYASETNAPMLQTGYNHEFRMDSFAIHHNFTAIPSSGTAGYTYDTIMVDKSIAIDENKMRVFVSLQHDVTSEVKIELISPGNDSVTLVSQISRGTKGYTCVLNNETANRVNGSFIDISPVIGSQGALSVFNGKNSQGKWTLKITDLANGNVGQLNSWGLFLYGDPYVNSVKNAAVARTMQVFPNPGHGQFTLKCPADLRQGELTVTDLAGRNVLTQTVDASKGNLTFALPASATPGTYVVTLSHAAGKYTCKLLVN